MTIQINMQHGWKHPEGHQLSYVVFKIYLFFYRKGKTDKGALREERGTESLWEVTPRQYPACLHTHIQCNPEQPLPLTLQAVWELDNKYLLLTLSFAINTCFHLSVNLLSCWAARKFTHMVGFCNTSNMLRLQHILIGIINTTATL